jgi:hypothetical protein
MKSFVVLALVSSLFLFWIVGEGGTASIPVPRLGTEVYQKDDRASSTSDQVASTTISTVASSTQKTIIHITDPERNNIFCIKK